MITREEQIPSRVGDCIMFTHPPENVPILPVSIICDSELSPGK